MFESNRAALSVRALASCVVFTACGLWACSDDSCETGSRQLDYGEQSSELGVSVEEGLEGGQGQAGTLQWNPPPDWLSYTAEGEAEIVTRFEHRGAQVREERGIGSACEVELETDVSLRVATADGQLLAEVDASVSVQGERDYELLAVIDRDQLAGLLQVPGNVTLALVQEVTGDRVEGRLTAVLQEVNDETSNLRQFVIGRWQGETGDVEFPEPVDPTEPEFVPEPSPDAGSD